MNHFPLPKARFFSKLLGISGQLALDRDGQVVGEDAPVLAEPGLSKDESSMSRSGLATPAISEASTNAEFFGAHGPARSTVVPKLVLPDALIELEAVGQAPLDKLEVRDSNRARVPVRQLLPALDNMS